MASNEDQPLPPEWTEEHDDFIIYLAHSPIVWPEDSIPEAIYENVTGVYLYLGSGFYNAFGDRLQYLSFVTNKGRDVLEVIKGKGYWWMYNPDYSPWTRRNPRREARNREWRGRGA
ncbi:hypothetical protein MMC24_000987 [Lignoscripta atroalba]|nr:hypothetical protein [Lignoscripta atroalba]